MALPILNVQNESRAAGSARHQLFSPVPSIPEAMPRGNKLVLRASSRHAARFISPASGRHQTKRRLATFAATAPMASSPLIQILKTSFDASSR